MPTTKTKHEAKYDPRTAMYAYIGAGQFFVEKAKELSSKATDAGAWRQKAEDRYQDFAKRGEKLVESIRRSRYTERALEQSKTARSQVKAATTSVRKAVSSTTEAARAAAKKAS